MTDGEAYVMFALERLKVCGPKMAILGKEGPRHASIIPIENFLKCSYCGGPFCVPAGCEVRAIEQGVKR